MLSGSARLAGLRDYPDQIRDRPGGQLAEDIARAPVGYLAIALNPVTTNQGFKSFVPSKGYGTSFVYYAVQRSLPTIIRHASGSTFVEIPGGVLKSVHAVLADHAVADAFCKQIKSVFQRQQQAELENIELTQLRDWLLPLLMNGQVRVA